MVFNPEIYIPLDFGQNRDLCSNWKLNYRICAWIPTSNYPDDQNLLQHLPNVCSQSPAFKSAFCKVHKQIIESFGYPSELRKFIDRCGADSTCFTKQGRLQVKSVLESLSKAYTGELSTQSGDEAQGTRYLLRDRTLATATNFEMTEPPEERCKKNTGIDQFSPCHIQF